MKKIIAFVAVSAIALPLHAMAGTASWTNWSTTTPTTGTLTQNSTPVTVTYTGSTFSTDYSADIYDVPVSFTTPAISNTPETNGTILMRGGTMQDNNISWGNFHFSTPVTNPVIDLISVGQIDEPVSFVFNTSNFSILKSGPGHWGDTNSSLTQSGNTVIGEEGNGLLQFVGVFSDIYFTLPDYEDYYGATVGAPTATPIPAAIWLFGSALAGLVGVSRRKTGNEALSA